MNNPFNPTNEYVSSEEFGSLFDTEWERMSSRFFKFESHQFYDEGDGGPFSHYLAGNEKLFINSLKEAREEDRPFNEDAIKRGVNLTRIHSIRLPMSKYIEFECYSYILSDLQGEDIFLAEEDSIFYTMKYTPPDFILFDSSCLFMQDYDNRGVLKGVWVSRDKKVIGSAANAYLSVMDIAKPFKEVFDGEKELIKLLVA